MRPPPPTPERLVADLREVVGDRHVLDDPEACAPYAIDWTGRFRGATPAVVRPGSAAEVAEVLRRCRAAGAAVVPQGGNTGLVGGSVPLRDEVVLSVRRLGHVGRPDLLAGTVVAGGGATVAQVQQAARAVDRAYAVDLAARDSATVGGTVATNAGGLHVLRWGPTRAQLAGVEAVLADGSVVSHLGGLAKDNTGYDLAGLLCGSEGTLGVVTAACLRLVGRPRHRTVALLGMADLGAAVGAVGAWRADLPSLVAAELMVDVGVDLVVDRFGLPEPLARRWPAYLLVEAAGVEDPAGELAEAVASTTGVGEVAVATDAGRAARLWRYREAHTDAIALLGEVVKLDVTLPAGELAGFCEEVGHRVAAVAPAARTWLFGHVGDGNVHVNVTGADGAEEAVTEAVLVAVAERAGSISAEHGIGTAKRRWLHLSRSPEEIAAFRALKSALDPDGTLNPNVLLPPP